MAQLVVAKDEQEEVLPEWFMVELSAICLDWLDRKMARNTRKSGEVDPAAEAFRQGYEIVSCTSPF